MLSKINPEKLYEEYRARNDIKKEINGQEYTRVADSEVISIGKRDLFMIYI